MSVNYTTKALNYQIPRTVTFGRIKYRLGLNASALSVTDHRFRRNMCGVWRRQTRPWKPPLNMQEPGKLSVVLCQSGESCSLHRREASQQPWLSDIV